MIKSKLSGYIMAGVGFLMILTNALDYVFGWHTIQPAFGTVGVVFLVIGLTTARKTNQTL